MSLLGAYAKESRARVGRWTLTHRCEFQSRSKQPEWFTSGELANELERVTEGARWPRAPMVNVHPKWCGKAGGKAGTAGSRPLKKINRRGGPGLSSAGCRPQGAESWDRSRRLHPEAHSRVSTGADGHQRVEMPHAPQTHDRVSLSLEKEGSPDTGCGLGGPRGH